ncbi:unnamed protein product, partial [Urochloa humidicola]
PSKKLVRRRRAAQHAAGDPAEDRYCAWPGLAVGKPRSKRRRRRDLTQATSLFDGGEPLTMRR